MNKTDLGEMLGMAYISKEAGFKKVQIDTDDIIEILEKLLGMKEITG